MGGYKCSLGNSMGADRRFWRNYGSLSWMTRLGSHNDKVNIPRSLTATVYEAPTVCILLEKSLQNPRSRRPTSIFYW